MSDPLCEHADLYAQPGPLGPQLPGWTFVPSTPGADGQTYNPAEGYYPDKGGRLLGPAIAVGRADFRFFELSFEAETARPAYWGVLFEDAAGQALVADNYASVYSGERRLYRGVLYGREGALAIRPFFQSPGRLSVANLRLREISAAAAAAWCDELYATLPPLGAVPAERPERLPRTLAALASGSPWRLVMLGDSIVNDTFNSNFPALLQRLYPRSDLRVVCSVRGGTGCWYYQDPGQFQGYVADQRPDLLLIGGICQRGDTAAIRQVIERALRTLSCEILLVSGPLGDDWRQPDPAHPDAPLPAQAPPPDPFPAQLRELAAAYPIAYLDMATPWQRYLGASCRPWQWFHRDRVHGNDRGKQVLARYLEAYFRP